MINVMIMIFIHMHTQDLRRDENVIALVCCYYYSAVLDLQEHYSASILLQCQACQSSPRYNLSMDLDLSHIHLSPTSVLTISRST